MRVTKHGNDRARERIGIPKKAVERNAQSALLFGLDQSHSTGSLRRYLAALYERYDGAAGNIRVYGNFVYVFNEEILITVLNLPTEYRRSAVAQLKRRNGNER